MQNLEHKIVSSYLSISFKFLLGAQLIPKQLKHSIGADECLTRQKVKRSIQ